MWLDVAEVWLQLVREDKVRCLLVDIPKEELTHFLSKVLEEYHYKGLVAGFRYQKQEVLVEKHPVITGARRGDLIRVIRFVEDRHDLGVQSFQMTLLH